MWITSILKKNWPKLARTAEAESKNLYTMLEEGLSGLSIKRSHIFETIKKAGLNADKPAAWSEEDFLRFVDTVRRISKPMLIVANKIDLPTAKANLERLKKLNYTVIPCCAEAELALRRAAEKQLIDYKPGDCNFQITQPEKLTPGQTRALETIREKILLPDASTGAQDAINTAYLKLLNMITVYPVEDLEHLSDHNGKVLPDVYLSPYGTTAHHFAYIIHTALGDSFIYAVDAREKRRIGEDAVFI